MATKPGKNKGGRPKTIFTEQQKHMAIKYVEDSGLYKIRIADLLGVDRKTFDKILKQDKEFKINLDRADSIFFANLVSRAKPEFILRNRFPDEFPDPPRSRSRCAVQEKNDDLKEFLDRWDKSQIEEAKMVE